MGKNKPKLAVVLAKEVLREVNCGGLVQLSYYPAVDTMGEARLIQLISSKIRKMKPSTLGQLIDYGASKVVAEGGVRASYQDCMPSHRSLTAHYNSGRASLEVLAYAVVRAAITDELHRMRANALFVIDLSPEQ